MNASSQQFKTTKIPSLGGAIAGFLAVCTFSGFVIGWLMDSLANPIRHVKRTVQSFKNDGHKIGTFAADSGIVSRSQYQVLVPETHQYSSTAVLAAQWLSGETLKMLSLGLRFDSR